MAAIEIGGAYAATVPFMQSIRGILRQLAARTDETASLAVLQGSDALYLMREEGSHSVFTVSRVGQRLPAHATAVGKALLAQLSDGEVRALYAKESAGLRRITNSTITSVPELSQDLRGVRLKGYSFESEEIATGRCCFGVAVALADHPNDTIAMSVSTDVGRLSEVQEELVARLLEARQAITNEASARAALGEPSDSPTVASRVSGGYF